MIEGYVNTVACADLPRSDVSRHLPGDERALIILNILCSHNAGTWMLNRMPCTILNRRLLGIYELHSGNR
jgi:hypothetical protein